MDEQEPKRREMMLITASKEHDADELEEEEVLEEEEEEETKQPSRHFGNEMKENKTKRAGQIALNEARNRIDGLALPVYRIVTDSNGQINYVHDGFTKYTGYEKEEFLGRKCSFLQGQDTDPEDVDELRIAIRSKRPVSTMILNYTKNRVPFWNILTITPHFNDELGGGRSKEITHFVGEIISLPIPRDSWNKPRLCLDDGLALMRYMTSIPSTISRGGSNYSPPPLLTLSDDTQTAENEIDEKEKVLYLSSARVGEEEHRESDDDKSTGSESSGVQMKTQGNQPPLSPSSSTTGSGMYYKHINYSERLMKSSSSSSSTSDSRSRSPMITSEFGVNVNKFDFVAETLLPTNKGRFRVRAYRNASTGAEPLALIVGDVENSSNVLCRVHDQCVTSEVFGSLRCDCREQLEHALASIQENTGIVMYLPQEGRGIGLANKIAAYAVQQQGYDTVDANRHLGLPDDAREYHAVKDILDDLHISSIRLMTNNPLKIRQLELLSIHVSERVPCIVECNSDFSHNYVKAKVNRMGHMIDGLGISRSNSTPPGLLSSPNVVDYSTTAKGILDSS